MGAGLRSAIDLLEQAAAVVIAGVPILWGSIIAYALLTGGINCNGLISTKPGGNVSPERVQMLLTTLVGVGYCLAAFAGGVADPFDISQFQINPLLAGLGVSHGLYLFGKYRQMI